MPIRLPAFVLAFAFFLSGCGGQNSYAAAEAGLRDWLTAAHDGDRAACSHMTAEHRQEMAATTSSASFETQCHLVLAAVAADPTSPLPSADEAMSVLAWDPSGEALVEVGDADQFSQLPRFWMRWDGDRWLVAGRAD